MHSVTATFLRIGFLITLTCLGWLGVAAEANALGSNSNNRFTSWFSNSSKPQFIRVEEAFKFTAEVEGSQLFIHWQIEPAYYLYKHRAKITLDESSGLQLTQVHYPEAIKHEDEYFGTTEIYYQELELIGDLAGTTTASELEITVFSQGCADAGLCYPPQEEKVLVSLAKLDTSQPPKQLNSQAQGVNTPPVSSFSYLSNQLASGKVWLTLGLFFLAGLGLTFTPCVLPMLPILSSIILGKGDQTVQHAKTRGFMLSCAYVLGMALAYAFIGAFMGWFGSSLNLPAAMQSPWLIIPAALIFLLLALNLFGVWHIRLPYWLDKHLQSLQQPKGGTLAKVALMGALSTLIVSPCLTAPLAGALAFIATTGSIGLGSLALFALGLGMGVPLILTGTFGAHWLPKAGAWMNQVKAFFGFILLVTAAWLVDRLLVGTASLFLWAVVALGTGVFIGGFNFAASTVWQKLRLSCGILLIIYAVSLMVGGLAGSTNLWQPLAGFKGGSVPQVEQNSVPMFTELAELENFLAASTEPVLVDLYADWCISCKVMEAKVFARADVQAAMQGITRVQFDLTKISAPARAWLNEHQLFGPPTLMFFQQGQEQTAWRLPGEVGAQEFLQHLEAFIASTW